MGLQLNCTDVTLLEVTVDYEIHFYKKDFVPMVCSSAN